MTLAQKSFRDYIKDRDCITPNPIEFGNTTTQNVVSTGI